MPVYSINPDYFLVLVTVIPHLSNSIEFTYMISRASTGEKRCRSPIWGVEIFT